ncbi:MAG: hypothetical protein ACQKBW_12320 [Puniceicoccales bacterium]
MSEHEPVTLYITRRFKPGSRAFIEQWQRDITVACQDFPGFLGNRILEPHTDAEQDVYSVVVRFDKFENLRRWEESPERNRLYDQLQPHIVDQTINRLTGFEPWFPSPNGPTPPPKWKMCLMAFIAVYPLIVGTRYALGWLVAGWPMPLGAFVMCITVSLLMSYVAMPSITKLFRKWLYP